MHTENILFSKFEMKTMSENVGVIWEYLICKFLKGYQINKHLMKAEEYNSQNIVIATTKIK